MRRLNLKTGKAAAARLLDQAAAHVSARRLAEARAAYERAERADITDFRAPLSLATVELALGHADRALPPLRRASRLAPGHFEVQHNLGAVAQSQQQWEEAAQAYDRALELQPHALDTRRNLAIVLAILGRIDAALAQHRWLTAQPSTRLWALTRIGLLRPAAISDGDLDQMRVAATDGATDAETRAGLWFALGETLERRGDDDAAFGAFAEGNRAKRAIFLARQETNPPALLKDHVRSARLIERTFTHEYLAAHQGPGLSTEAPIFIVGMPRSGSTLIEQILASHPQVTSLGETATLPGLLESGPLLGQADKAEVRRLARLYLSAARARGWRGTGRFVDKTLENYLHVGAIAMMFPRATILHATRDPMDTCFSCYRQFFAAGSETLYDLGDIGVEYVSYRAVVDHWRCVLPGRMIEIDHEALVSDPDARIRWLVTNACRLPWNDACLAFHQTDGPVRTASSGQVRQPIFNTSIGRWRRYQRHLGPLKAALQPYARSQT